MDAFQVANLIANNYIFQTLIISELENHQWIMMMHEWRRITLALPPIFPLPGERDRHIDADR